MNGRFFGACFFIFGTKRSCCSIDDYSSILQQPLLKSSALTDPPSSSSPPWTSPARLSRARSDVLPPSSDCNAPWPAHSLPGPVQSQWEPPLLPVRYLLPSIFLLAFKIYAYDITIFSRKWNFHSHLPLTHYSHSLKRGISITFPPSIAD